MIGTLLRYFNLTFITLFILIVLSFGLGFFFPGDTLTNLIGEPQGDTTGYTQLAQAFEREDILAQFWAYLQTLAQGQWGHSLSTGLPIAEQISQTFPATLELSFYGAIVSLLIGVPCGMLAGFQHHKLSDYSLMSVSMVMVSLPVFWLALLLILVFCLQLQILPMSGRLSLLYNIDEHTGFVIYDILQSDVSFRGDALLDAIKHLILPTVAVSFITTAVLLRTTRRAVVDVMATEYIKTAQTRGLSFWVIFSRHVLRNVLLAILPLFAIQISTLVTNVMIVETVFAWPGTGSWLIQAIYERDYPAIRIGMLVVSSAVVLFAMSIECISRLINPSRELQYG